MHPTIRIVAQYFIVLPVLLTAALFLELPNRRQRRDFVILLLIGGLTSLLLAFIGGYLIYDPRPFVLGHFKPLIAHAADNGFPSDHVLLGSFLGWSMLKYSRKFGITCLALAALIGAARVLAGVHHVEDVVGSFLISGASVLAVTALLKKYES